MLEKELEYFLTQYKKLGLNDSEALIVAHLVQACSQGQQASLEMLQERMTLTADEARVIILRFAHRGWVRALPKQPTKFDCSRLIQLFSQWTLVTEIRDPAGPAAVAPVVTDGDLIEAEAIFEKSFHNRLTPLQREEVQRLVNGYGRELVLEALRRAIINDKLTLRYIGVTLERWKKEGINQIIDLRQQEKNHSEKPRGRKVKGAASEAELDQYAQIMALLIKDVQE